MMPADLSRYQCQINLDEIGALGQQRLAQASLLCVGAGGLACAALPYLVAAGVGKITIVDGDTVSISNLHRQILYTVDDVDLHKAQLAATKLQQQNPEIQITAMNTFFGADNADALVAEHDVVLDCTDNYYARYLISDTCQQQQKPDIFAAVMGYEGYLTIFGLKEGPCYRCLYPEPPTLQNVTNCSEAGVLGTVPGLFGLLQATEALKFILKIEPQLVNRLLKVDLKNLSFKTRTMTQSSACALCAGTKKVKELDRFTVYGVNKVANIDASLLDQHKNHYVCIDVREADELALYNPGFVSMPFSTFSVDAFTKTMTNKSEALLIICAHGIRSSMVTQLLQQEGYTNVVNLSGGIEKYRQLCEDA